MAEGLAERLGRRLGLRVRVFLFFALIGLGGLALTLAALVAAGWDAPTETRRALALWGGGAAAASLGLVVWVWLKFDEHVARPVERVGRGTLAAAHGGAPAVETACARWLGPLGAGASAAAEALAQARAERDTAVAAATAAANRRRRQLETVLRDLDQALAICATDHRLTLYNARAARLLEGRGEIGLGRPLIALLAAQPIEHALETVRRRFEEGRGRERPDWLSAPFVAASADGALTVQGRLTLMPDPDGAGASGYAVLFDDVTGAHEGRLRRDRALRRGLDAVAAALEAPASAPVSARAALERLRAEAAAMSAAEWPMAEVWSATLWTSIIRRRTGPQNFSAEIVGRPCWLTCDSVGVVEALDTLLNRLADGLDVRAFSLSAEAGAEDLDGQPGRVVLRIAWTGPEAPEALLADWARTPLAAAIGGVTPAELLVVHGAELAHGADERGRRTLTLSLPGPTRAHSAPPAAPARPEFYDFDLLDRPLAQGARPDAPLKALSYVVFDTETTGLDPSRGDRLVQIAGVRVLNGRVLKGERFETLVNPGRRIPVAATRIHGVDNRMVETAPPAADALRRFHAFCEGAVLVAHNAAFDMRFLTLETPADGPAFDHPVLDTVLLAAHLNGQEESLTLDALAARFAVDLPAAARHTALGDSLATAEVFLRLLDMLEARGVRTLGEALEASRGPAAIRRRQAAY